LFFLLGAAIAYFLVGKVAQSAGLPPKPLRTFIIWCFPISFIGQRLAYIIADLDYYIEHPKEVVTSTGGMFYGALILCSLFFIFYIKRKGLPFYKSADALYPLVLAQPLGRIGCLFDGCCFGNPTTMPWGIPSRYSMILHSRGVDDLMIHPTQLYHFVADSILFIILHYVFKHKRFDGQVLVVYLAGYAVSRFIIEFYRYDFKLGLNVYSILSTNQVISVIIFLVAGILFIRLHVASKNINLEHDK
jgi:phosphatidylglycerol:prolipoprotein diacylglycerol transferase